MATKNKFPEWGRTEDGTEVRLCPLEKTDGKPLYCSRDGAFYSRRLIHGEWRFRRIIVNQRPPRDTRLCHTRYPSVRQYGNVMCHTVMALTWIGPRPDAVSDRDGKAIRFECDHINGNIYDWRAENLQWVTPEENRKRAVILRARRMIARQDNDPSKDPDNMQPEELLKLFNSYNVAGDVYAGE